VLALIYTQQLANCQRLKKAGLYRGTITLAPETRWMSSLNMIRKVEKYKKFSNNQRDGLTRLQFSTMSITLLANIAQRPMVKTQKNVSTRLIKNGQIS